MIDPDKRTAAICLCLFALAVAVRLVVWQNNTRAIDAVQYVVTEVYKRDARLLVAGDVRTFLAGPDPPSDATIIMHPPGYPVFIAAIYGIFGEGESLRVIQLLLNSLAAVLSFLIARRLFGLRAALIAGVLTASAPQFAYHSSIILPDEMSALPILLGLYFFVRAWQEQRLIMAAYCGIALGLSCWLRSNALLLPAFFAAAALVFPRQWRARPALVMLATFVIVIAPITSRNYVFFQAFVPLSVGSGTTFVEGLADIDADGRTGLPSTDEGVMAMDAAKAGRPDYYGNLYAPDGIERERSRTSAGLTVVAAHPGWFVANVLARGTMVFRMERVPVIDTQQDEKATTSTPLYLLNIPLKLIQRLFITAVFLPLFLFGVLLLLRDAAARGKLAILSVVPAYYFLVQPLVHTEYRYLLPAAHLLVTVSAVSLSWLVGSLMRIRSKIEGFKRRNARRSGVSRECGRSRASLQQDH